MFSSIFKAAPSRGPSGAATPVASLYSLPRAGPRPRPASAAAAPASSLQRASLQLQAEQMRRINRELDRKEGRITELQHENASLRRARDELGSRNNRVRALEERCRALEGEVRQAALRGEEQLVELQRLKGAEANLKGLEEHARRTEMARAEEGAEAARLRTRLEEAQGAGARLEASKTQLEESLIAAQSSIETQSLRQVELSGTIDALREDLQKTLLEGNDEVRALVEARDRATADLEAQQDENARLRGEGETAARRAADLELRAGALARDLDRARRDLEGARAQQAEALLASSGEVASVAQELEAAQAQLGGVARAAEAASVAQSQEREHLTARLEVLERELAAHGAKEAGLRRDLAEGSRLRDDLAGKLEALEVQGRRGAEAAEAAEAAARRREADLRDKLAEQEAERFRAAAAAAEVEQVLRADLDREARDLGQLKKAVAAACEALFEENAKGPPGLDGAADAPRSYARLPAEPTVSALQCALAEQTQVLALRAGRLAAGWERLEADRARAVTTRADLQAQLAEAQEMHGALTQRLDAAAAGNAALRQELVDGEQQHQLALRELTEELRRAEARQAQALARAERAAAADRQAQRGDTAAAVAERDAARGALQQAEVSLRRAHDVIGYLQRRTEGLEARAREVEREVERRLAPEEAAALQREAEGAQAAAAAARQQHEEAARELEKQLGVAGELRRRLAKRGVDRGSPAGSPAAAVVRAHWTHEAALGAAQAADAEAAALSAELRGVLPHRLEESQRLERERERGRAERRGAGEVAERARWARARTELEHIRARAEGELAELTQGGSGGGGSRGAGSAAKSLRF